MAWIEPLQLEYIIRNVFSGNTAIFTGIMILIITAMAGYFRMVGMTLFLMIGIFFIMFYNYIDQSIYFVLISVGGLLIG